MRRFGRPRARSASTNSLLSAQGAVGPAIVPTRRQHAHAKGEREAEDGRKERQGDGVREGREKKRRDRPSRLDRDPEVPCRHVPEPSKILDRQRTIEAVSRPDHRDLLGRGVVRRHRGHGIDRSEIDKREADDGHADRDRHRIKRALDDIGRRHRRAPGTQCTFFLRQSSR